MFTSAPKPRNQLFTEPQWGNHTEERLGGVGRRGGATQSIQRVGRSPRGAPGGCSARGKWGGRTEESQGSDPRGGETRPRRVAPGGGLGERSDPPKRPRGAGWGRDQARRRGPGRPGQARPGLLEGPRSAHTVSDGPSQASSGKAQPWLGQPLRRDPLILPASASGSQQTRSSLRPAWGPGGGEAAGPGLEPKAVPGLRAGPV